MKNIKEVLLEVKLSRIQAHADNRNMGMITAHRGEYSSKENGERNKELEGKIRAGGYGFVKVRGRYTENYGTKNAKSVDEHSYMILGKKGPDDGALLDFLKQHGSHYKQDSILHKAHNEDTAKLHGTKEGGFPGMGQTHDVGTFHPSRAGEFHSVMKNKKTFAFETIRAVSDITFTLIE